MEKFSIRDIENLCGIKAHTIRVWEQRYGISIPKRKSGNHRFYNSEDLKNLLRISFLYNNGYKISSIAKLDSREIDQLVNNTVINQENFPSFISRLIEASVDFDESRFLKLTDKLLRKVGFETGIKDLFYPFLQKMGLLWLSNHVIPAQEHFSSNLIRQKIIAATDRLPVPDFYLKRVLIFSFPGEYHEIPLLVAGYHFKKNKQSVSFFGTHVSKDAVSEYCRYRPVDYFYTHVITNIAAEKINSYTDFICNRYPTKKLVISGPATCCLKKQYPNLVILQSYDEMVKFTQSI
ncbi:MAG: MerR family transcriptional regulator [Terrimonas sp.]|nr:MerR family transcriptional regulator [Terrimonas sp.]